MPLNFVKFIVPGKQVPYVRTTMRAKYVSRQWQRYAVYKTIVALSFSIEMLDYRLGFTGGQEAISIIAIRGLLTAYRESLLKMINKSQKDILDNRIEVIIREV
jgi:hypothetical protein